MTVSRFEKSKVNSRKSKEKKMRKILITNDDGIASDGIVRLARAAKAFGEVWVVAPDSQRSAVSHSVILRRDILVWETDFPVDGVHAFACDGMPADCVRIGVLNIVPGGPDVILSGINFGFNAATDIQYSATAGAAFEGAFQGIRSIAFSEDCSPEHSSTDRYLPEILSELIDCPPGENRIWNVNFPGCRAEECRGILRDRKVSTACLFSDSYLPNLLPDGKTAYNVCGKRMSEAEEGTDLRAVFDNYVSIGIVNNIQ